MFINSKYTRIYSDIDQRLALQMSLMVLFVDVL